MNALGAQSATLLWFENCEVGVVHLDARRNVMAMNDGARQIFPFDERCAVRQLVLPPAFAHSQSQLLCMLDQAEHALASPAKPISMMVHWLEQVLLFKATRLLDQRAHLMGFVLKFYDVTQMLQSAAPLGPELAAQRLQKVPVLNDYGSALVDPQDIFFVQSDAHATSLCTRAGWQRCIWGIGDLAARLDPLHFMRVHRCYVVNLRAVAALRNEAGKSYLHFKDKQHPRVPVARATQLALRQALGLQAH